MLQQPINTIGVIGSGTMGAGIAQVVALAGLKAILYDLNGDVLDKAARRIGQSVEKAVLKAKAPAGAVNMLRTNLSLTTDLSVVAEQAELIIEAVPEDMLLKQDLFANLDKLAPSETCFATNTSSLSVTALAGITKRPERVAGMHFFNPVPQMKLVEVIQGRNTAPELVDALCDLARKLGKTPVKAQDTPGFIVNRVARAFYGEALRLIDEQACSISELDRIIRDEGGFAMGPFELMDLIGIDVNYAVSQSVYHAFFEEDRFKPHPIQRQMVEAGHLGRKTKRGFYRYDV